MSSLFLRVIFLPICVCLILYLLTNLTAQIMEVPDRTNLERLHSVEECTSPDNSCRTIRFAPSGVPWVEELMRNVASDAGLTFGKDVVEFERG